MDYYRILDIGRNASQAEIKKAHRKLSAKYHPDNAGERSREQFDRVQEAFAVLGNEEKRRAYDERHGSKINRRTAIRIWQRFIPGRIRTVLINFLERE